MKCGLPYERKNIYGEYKKILCGRIFGPEGEEVMRDWRKWFN